MTEHVHEWEIRKRSLEPFPYYWFECKHCHRQLSGADVLARLNAAERLSAEDLFPEGFAIVHPNLDKLIAYANILEGKDD